LLEEIKKGFHIVVVFYLLVIWCIFDCAQRVLNNI
jgi:hypothetical protein